MRRTVAGPQVRPPGPLRVFVAVAVELVVQRLDPQVRQAFVPGQIFDALDVIILDDESDPAADAELPGSRGDPVGKAGLIHRLVHGEGLVAVVE